MCLLKSLGLSKKKKMMRRRVGEGYAYAWSFHVYTCCNKKGSHDLYLKGLVKL